MKSLKFSTEVDILPSEWKISSKTKLLTIGSCFSDVLGMQLKKYKFSVLNNPLGTVFNPLTITKILESALDGKLPNPALYFQDPDHIWMHHDFHASLWSNNKKDLEVLLTDQMEGIRTFLADTDVVVITLGTAYAYRHRSTNLVIGNCHKLPSDLFMKELLNTDQINMALEQLISKLMSFRRNLKIILTVSPVRHTRDTLPLNQVSKATLRLACHRLSEKFRHVTYFPSYEIMIDELRDYRYYEPDLIHPSSLAEEFIFRTFAQAFMDSATLNFTKEWDSILQMMNHRPLHGFTDSHLKLLKTIKTRLSGISHIVDVTGELAETDARIREFPLS